MNVAIIGCGVVGARRAAHIGRDRIVCCVDTDIERARRLAEKHASAATDDWRVALADPAVDCIVICTPPLHQAEVARAAIESGRHVLIEKPAARCAEELRDLPALAANRGVVVRVGFNHRFHPALRQAKELADRGAIGTLLYVRARYGHGGRLGYEHEWRADPRVAGGGELLDQGVHLIDLARWFFGEFPQVDGFAHTYFWPMPVDDNGFMLLKTATNQVAYLHASCTEWKNTFSWELYGRDGKLQVDGLGGSYGTERLTWYKMSPQMGPPETTVWEFPAADDSWSVEWQEFLRDIEQGRRPAAGLEDAIAALTIVGKIYAKSGYDHRA